MKFIVDTNVGKLAKWLRISGFDAVFFRGKEDAAIILQALHEERVILTRDTRLMQWGVIRNGNIKAMLILNDNIVEQISQVIKQFHLDPNTNAFSICPVCNQKLESINKEEVREQVPSYVYRTQTVFMRCPSCRRIYWRGTHWDAMSKQLSIFQS